MISPRTPDDRLNTWADQATGGDGGHRSGEVDLSELAAILFRQWPLIGIVTALFIGGGLTYATLAPKVWQSTARVLLDPRDKQVAGPGLSQPLSGVDTVWVDTQANIVTSGAILSAVADKLDLEKDPEFGGSRDETLRNLGTQTIVQRADQTYVLDISVRSRSAERSARIAQALAEEFVANQVEVKEAAVREASALINRQLEDLRTKARDAQEKLETYKRDHGILTANGRSVDEDTLRQQNDAYVAARLRTQEAKARRDKIAAARSDGYDSALSSIESSVLSRLKIERALAARTVGELSQDLGPSHPRMVAARSDLNRADAQITAELRSLAQSAEAEVQVAAAAEASARKALDDASAVVTDTGERTIELRELENEATLRADMYKNYVTRTAEIGLQANTQVSDARVIVPADLPLYPFSPRKTIILALSAIAGFGLALSLAIYRGRRYLNVRRDEVPPVIEPQLDVDDADDEPENDVGIDLPEESVATGDDAIAVSIEPEPVEAAAEAKDDAADADGVPPVLAELTVATRAFLRNREGRPVARSPRAILSSAIADGDELPPPVISHVFGDLTRKIKAAAGASRTILVLGADDGPSAGAVSFGLAHVPTRGGLLLIDASWDDLPLSRAFVDDDVPGVIDVITGSADAASIAICENEPDLTLISIGDARQADAIDDNVMRIADFVDRLADDFGRVVLHCGHRHSSVLVEALIGRVDAVLIVADAIVEADKEAAALVRDLAAAVPTFAGLVLVSERRAEPLLANRRA